MRRIPLLLAMIGTFSGCLVSDTHFTLKPDGSGALSITYSMDEDTGVQLKGILSVRQAVAFAADPTFTPTAVDHWIDMLISPAADDLERELAPYRSVGLTTESVRVIAYEGRREVRMKLGFTNIADLTKLDIFPHLGFRIQKQHDGMVTIKREGRVISTELTKLLDDPAYLEQITAVMTGFSFRITFDTPSPISATSGTKIDNTRAEWLFDFDTNPQAVLALQNKELSVTIDGKGLTLPDI